MKQFGLFFCTALALCSCRYQDAALNINGSTTITTSIPVIKKDPNGLLRNYLAREMAQTGSLYYKDSGAKYALKVKIDKDDDSHVSFMWDRDPVTDENLHVYYPSEGMREVVAKVELVDASTGEAVIEPFFIDARTYFDFVNPTVKNSVQFRDALGGDEPILQYSLGQLDSEEGAKAESFDPVYKRLAKKIVSRLLKSSRSIKK